MPLPLEPLVALGFANPLLLWGLAAAGVPILLHLLNRRRFKEVKWAAMRFLTSAIQKNRRRIRIEQWLLLAVRTLLIICLVLGLAQPFLEQLGALPLLPGQRTHRVVVLDASMSMGFTAGGRSRFERAKELAGNYLKKARRGDLVSVVLMASPAKALIGEPSGNLSEVRDELASVVPTDGPVDLAGSFRKVSEVLQASTMPRKEIFVVSDLQARSWLVEPSEQAEVSKLLDAFEKDQVTSIVVDVGSASGSNEAITELRLDSSLITIGGPPSLVSGTIRHFGEGPAGAPRVRLYVDGRQTGEQVVQLGSGGEASVSVPARFDRRGDHLVEFRLSDDALASDNSRRMAVTVRDALKVLVVDGDYDPEPFAAETDYLAQALAPSEGAAQQPRLLDLQVVTDSRLGSQDLDEFDAVVLANVAQLDASTAGRLEAFLVGGGGLVVFGGERVLADNYNAILHRDGKGPLPAKIGETVGSDPTPERPGESFDPIGFVHPIVAAYAGTQDLVLAGLTGVKTWKHEALSVPENSPAQVAMRFSDGSPAIVEGRFSRGVVVQVATTADAAWTNWPLHPSYPPILEEIVTRAASGRQQDRNVISGQPLTAPFPSSAQSSPVGVLLPSGELRPTSLRPEGQISFLDFAETEAAGPYSVRLGPPAASELMFAVNPDPSESDLARTDGSALRQVFPAWRFTLVDGSGDLADDDPGRGARRGQLHRPMLGCVFGLLMFESFLAWRMGRQR